MTKIDLHQWDFGYIVTSFWNNLFHSNNGLAANIQHSSFFSPLFLILIVSIIIVLFLLRLYVRNKTLVKEESVLLEITPPAHTQKSAYAVQQLFSTVHGLGWERTKMDKILGKKPHFSFEIVSTRHQGIRYLVRTTPTLMNSFKKNLLSHLPDVSIKTVDEYLPENIQKLDGFHSKIAQYKLTKPFAHPLQKQNVLQESDPVAYITGQMTKLSPGELISLQIILSPTKVKETDMIAWKIKNNDNVLEYLSKTEYPLIVRIFMWILITAGKFISEVISAVVKVIQEMQLDAKSIERSRAYDMEYNQRLNAPKPPRILSPYEQEIIQSIKEKIEQPLFNTAIRLLVIAKDKKDIKERIDGFNSSLRTFAVPSYQELKIKRSIFDLL